MHPQTWTPTHDERGVQRGEGTERSPCPEWEGPGLEWGLGHEEGWPRGSHCPSQALGSEPSRPLLDAPALLFPGLAEPSTLRCHL